MRSGNIKTWLGVVFLVALEQGIKIIINNNYLDRNSPIAPPLLYFKPTFNRDYSWFNSMLQLGVGKWAHIVVVAVLSILIYLFYDFICHKKGGSKSIDILFAFVFSCAVCSLIDKVFWDGSLDYIQVKGFFTFDLKDVYVNVFIALLLLLILIKSKAIRALEDKNLAKDFVKYISRRSS